MYNEADATTPTNNKTANRVSIFNPLNNYSAIM